MPFKTNSNKFKVRKLKHTIVDLRKSRTIIELCWIPGHTGIQGNETADKNVKEASREQEEMILCSYQDVVPSINQAINKKWKKESTRENNKRREIKPDPKIWKETSTPIKN